MIPFSDGVPARRFPVVNVALIVANFAVWLLYELPASDAAILNASFYPCAVDHACHTQQPWGIAWVSAMFLHGSGDHIVGNMLFWRFLARTLRMHSATWGIGPSISPAGSSRRCCKPR